MDACWSQTSTLSNREENAKQPMVLRVIKFSSDQSSPKGLASAETKPEALEANVLIQVVGGL